MEITVKFNPSEMKMLKNGETIEVFRFLNPVKLPGGDLWAIHVQKEEKSTDSKYVSTGRSELTRTKEALKVLREGLVKNVEISTSWHDDGARGRSTKMCQVSNLSLMEADKILEGE